MKFNIKEKLMSRLPEGLDDAEKSVIGAAMVGNVLASIGIAIIALIVGIFITVLSWPKGYEKTSAVVTAVVLNAGKKDKVTLTYTVDGKEYTGTLYDDDNIASVEGVENVIYYNPEDPGEISTHNVSILGLVFGPFIIILGICAPFANTTATIRWFRKRAFEDEARRRPATDNEIDCYPIMNYTFSSEANEKLNEVMMDYSKKVAVVKHPRTDNFYLRDENGNIIINGRGRIGFSIFNSKYTVSGEEHIARAAILSNGPVVNLGRYGHIYDKGIHTSDFVIDGKLFWEEFYRDGYYFDRTYDGIRCKYSVCKNGREFMRISDRRMQNAMGVNIDALANLPCKGQYDIECKEKDLKLAWTLCYLFSTIDT